MNKRIVSLLAALYAALGANLAKAEAWTFDGSYMTTASGWKIEAHVISGTLLRTGDNGGMVKAAPATGDLTADTYTLDLSGTITDKDDPTKTYTLTTIGFYAFNGCPVKINAMVLPESLTTWKVDSAVGVFGRNTGTWARAVNKPAAMLYMR